jgi:hypothetical protein
MAKPQFRDYDEKPKRDDDMRLKAFGIELEASGRIVILTILALAALFLAGWAAYQNERSHYQLWRALEVQTCVLTLNEQERKEFRTEGKYCPTPRIKFKDEGVGRSDYRRSMKRVDHL